MTAAGAADALVALLPPTTFVVGKGGVGKTTCAAALALRASAGSPTLVLSTDPARALPTVLDQPLGSAPTPVLGSTRLTAQLLDAAPLRDRFLARWGPVIGTILDRGTYLDAGDIGPLVDTALPGSDEIFAALELAALLGRQRAEPLRLVVDTAPTGHTLRLFNLPRTFRALVRLLEAMQDKHRFMVRTLTRAYRSDDADAFLKETSGLVASLEESLRDPARCAAVVVTNDQPLVLDETRRYLESLAELRIRVAAVVWNACDGSVPDLDVHATQFRVERLEDWPVGRAGLERWLAALRPVGTVTREIATMARRDVRKADEPAIPEASPSAAVDALLRPLTIVAGKGGVGKTTVASAIALHAARAARTLVVSTDPAPSLADAFALPIPDADTPVEGAPRLFARQMDASAAFVRLRDEYQSRVDALFDGLVARGVDMAHDRAIARDLLALAPPGVDEVYALSLICDALFRDRFDRVVVDPAPTGHLLRLLEMPQLALTWTHQLMRLMLKYKDVAGLGETAAELLEFARNLRVLDARLRDRAQCGVVLVTLDEPVVQSETGRLSEALRERGIAIAGLVHNRSVGVVPLPAAGVPVHLEAPAVAPPPMGVTALRRWVGTWR